MLSLHFANLTLGFLLRNSPINWMPTKTVDISLRHCWLFHPLCLPTMGTLDGVDSACCISSPDMIYLSINWMIYLAARSGWITLQKYNTWKKKDLPNIWKFSLSSESQPGALALGGHRQPRYALINGGAIWRLNSHHVFMSIHNKFYCEDDARIPLCKALNCKTEWGSWLNERSPHYYHKCDWLLPHFLNSYVVSLKTSCQIANAI